jgi:hypothetical protein
MQKPFYVSLYGGCWLVSKSGWYMVVGSMGFEISMFEDHIEVGEVLTYDKIRGLLSDCSSVVVSLILILLFLVWEQSNAIFNKGHAARAKMSLCSRI